MGTQCYIITPKAAKTLYLKSHIIQMPIDEFMANYGKHKLNIIECLPHHILHDYSIPSQLGERKKTHKTPLMRKIVREFIIHTSNIKNIITQLYYFFIRYKNKLN